MKTSRWKDCGPSMARRYGPCMSIFLTLAMVLAHVLFALGQFKDLYHYEVVYSLSDVMVLVDLRFIGHHVYNVSLPTANGNVTILGESYNSTLHDLWTYNQENAWLDGNPNFAYNPNAPYILFWCLLIMSGLWPHCKLLAVHLLWYLPANPKTRKTWLWWLDFFGKYSMTDVFAMLTMVAWAAIKTSASTETLISDTVNNLPGFLANQTNVTVLVEELCAMKFVNKSEVICDYLLGFVAKHPEAILKHLSFSDMAGDITGALNVVTDAGLYFFSTAVWATLLISAAVNLLADSWKEKVEDPSITPLLLTVEDPCPCEAKPRSLMQGRGFGAQVLALLLLLCWAFVMAGGILVPMITRSIYGTLIELARVPGLFSDQQVAEEFSLLKTMDDVGDGGGNNAFLQKDLMAFTILFPCLMVLVSAAALFVPMKPKAQGVVVEAAKFCFSFSGWEILVLVTMVMLSELQALTVTIPVGVPALIKTVCPTLAEAVTHAPRGGVCFEEDLALAWKGFTCICVGACFMIGARLLIPWLHDHPPKC